MSQQAVDRLVKAYIKIRDDLDLARKNFKDLEAKRKVELAVVEDEIKKLADQMGTKSFRTDYGTATLVSKDFVSVKDWESTLEFVKQNSLWHLITKSVVKSEVKDYMEGHDNVVPPGLEYGMTQEIQVRRPTKTKA